MERAMMKRSLMRRGFTLVELLLVLVILAVLAAVVVPKFTGRSEQARITAAQADVNGMKSALEQYEVDNGKYPSTQEGLIALVEKPATAKAGWHMYLTKVPTDPWGHAYKYISPGSKSKSGYDLYSFGPDGQENTEDDLGNW